MRRASAGAGAPLTVPTGYAICRQQIRFCSSREGVRLAYATCGDSASEFELLSLFTRNPHRALNRDQIMEHVHHRDWDAFDRSIDLRVMRLRRKIEPTPAQPRFIRTVRDVGYMYVPAAHA